MQTRSQGIPAGAALLLPLFVSAAASAVEPAAMEGAGQGAIDAAQMRADMHAYFSGELPGGIWLMGIGAPALAGGTALVLQPNAFTRGLAYPLLAVGAIELVAGMAFCVNSIRRVPRFDREIGSRPAAFRDTELSRMRSVNRQMSLLEAAEITLVLASGVLAGAGALSQQDLLTGIGTGLMLQSSILLVYDQLAGRRAALYTQSLARFSVGVTGGPGRRGVLLTMVQRF